MSIIIKVKIKLLAGSLVLLSTSAFSEETTLSAIIVTATKPTQTTLGATRIAEEGLASRRSATSDSAKLLEDIPGISLYGAGGVSSLPAINGLADDRVRVQVDGMDLMAACPNHMNSALSYIDPTNVAGVKVFAGITPVSVGGDSIGGTIQVVSAPPLFAEGEDALTTGRAGIFYRSNGRGYGGDVTASIASRLMNLTYSGSSAHADNYWAGRTFKAAGPGQSGGPWLGGDEVGSTAYTAKNQNIGLSLQHKEHLLSFNVSMQNILYEGFPNQRMDMTANQGTQVNLGYSGQFNWGELEARYYYQQTDHRMDMGPDRFFYGTGMPMNTKAITTGGLLRGNIVQLEHSILRVGLEFQKYTLNDWWPPVGGTMGPNAFWNVDFGQRNKQDLFGEWESRWNTLWLSQIGIRSNTVSTNAGPVQGYDNGLGALWGSDAANFNAVERKRTDRNWDITALARFTPNATQIHEAGFARKTRSPSLYQRYPWSTNAMADLMNNFVGDGNGYIGNVNLKPEVANTLSATAKWRSAEDKAWEVATTAYYTAVQDFIDAGRCNFNQCSVENTTATTNFVHLQYVNQNARLYGANLSVHKLLAKTADTGILTASGLMNFVRGENRTTGDNLYNIMPLNLKLALKQQLGAWTHSIEFQTVAPKDKVSQTQNEIKTGGYSLVSLHTRLETKKIRFDADIENLFNRFYSKPLGGAYVGQGASMTTGGIPWGVPIPGMGRSINVALSINF
jgi:iron complex outermembrane receptor protein